MVIRIFWLFFKIGLLSAISLKRSRRELSIDVAEHRSLPLKIREECVLWLFFKIVLCSAISFKRSRRELSIDVAEHRSMLETYQNTLYPRFSFTPKTGKAFPKTGDLFLLCKLELSHSHLTDRS